ncbi:MAG: chaperone modulator CbpM [Betaproteobacteria bacterium]
MARELADALFLDEHAHYSITEVVSISGLDIDSVTVLVESGALTPEDARAAQWSFDAWSIEIARRALRLREEFALDDAHAVAIVVRFEQRVRQLEHELAALRARSGAR